MVQTGPGVTCKASQVSLMFFFFFGWLFFFFCLFDHDYIF